MCRILPAVAVSVLTLTILGATGARAQEPALLVNGDFEAGLDGWSRSFYPKGDGIEQCIYRSEQRAASGAAALCIDTSAALGKETVLVFNGHTVARARTFQGRRLVLTGGVYLDPETAIRPLNMRLRTFGTDEAGNGIFLGDVLQIKLLPRPGEWKRFRVSGTVPDADITGMDLHCSIRPDVVPTRQFLDDLRVEPYEPPALDIDLPRDAVWHDERTLPVEVSIGPSAEEGDEMVLRLVSSDGRELGRWQRPARSAIWGIGLPHPAPEPGSYLVEAALRDAGRQQLGRAVKRLEIAESPWADAPEGLPPVAPAPHLDQPVECFEAMGTTAPTEASDALPDDAEPLSPDLELPDARQRGYCVFARHYLDRVSALGRPRPGEIGPVRLFAAPGEFEPATVSIWAIDGLSDVRVTATDLYGEQAAIAAENIDVRLVRNMAGLPPFIEKRNLFDIPAGQTRTCWLTVRVPPDAAPGFYRGKIEVSAGDGDASIVLLLRVLPLQLPPPQKGYGFWWKMDTRWTGYYSQQRADAIEQIRKQFILLRDHGCNMVSCYGKPKLSKGDGGELQYDFTQDHWGHQAYSLDDFFALGRETGFLSAGVPIQYPGADGLHSHWMARAADLEHDSKQFDEFYEDACRRIDDWTKDEGFTLAFACIDEIGNSAERRRDALHYYRLADDAGALTSVTDNSMHGGVHLMGQKRFDEIIRMRLYNFITPEMIADTHDSGDILWLYNLGSAGWDAERDRYVFGALTMRCGAEGNSQWAFQWPSGNEGPYKQAAAGEKAGYHYALPAPDGPLPTLALEGVREGIDDARYLALLPESKRRSILDDVQPVSTEISRRIEEHSGNFMDLLRWRAARAAMAPNREPDHRTGTQTGDNGAPASPGNVHKETNPMSDATVRSNTDMGPLRPHPSNPRYFADGSGRPVYLTGAHTWSNLKDMGKTDPPPEFDFEAYLRFLQEHNHNFIRLWTWELAQYTYDGEMNYARPFPWARTGPGDALDGKPKFNLEQFNDDYFERLRRRVVAAGQLGIYVSVMLFEGHGLHASQKPWCWDGHPFNAQNNVNGVAGDTDGDGRGLEIQTLSIPQVTGLQEAYVRKVIDTVGDLDNILYEIANEAGSYSTEWQYHMIEFIHDYEQGGPKQHPVGMTFQYAREQRGTDAALFEGPADWVSPSPDRGYRDNPPAADGDKVIISDTDHLWGIGGNQGWVWKTFCRGMNPIFMDPYRKKPEGGDGGTWTDHLSDVPELDPRWEPIRKSLGYTRRYTQRMDLAQAVPHNELASTGYCLANPGEEYLVYLPDGGKAQVDLSAATGQVAAEWFDPTRGEPYTADTVAGGDRREFTAPFEGDAVLYLVVE